MKEGKIYYNPERIPIKAFLEMPYWERKFLFVSNETLWDKYKDKSVAELLALKQENDRLLKRFSSNSGRIYDNIRQIKLIGEEAKNNKAMINSNYLSCGIGFFKRDELFKDNVFPWEDETLYVAHPFRPIYIPVQMFKQHLLLDRVREFCRICQAWGATAITVRDCNSRGQYSFSDVAMSEVVGVSLTDNSLGRNKISDRKQTTLSYVSSHIGIHQEFLPKRSPYMPDELVWFNHEPSWQDLYKQRISDGSLITHVQMIDSSCLSYTSSEEIEKIENSLSLFNFSFKKSSNSMSWSEVLAQEEGSLYIDVKFAPIDTLRQ